LLWEEGCIRGMAASPWTEVEDVEEVEAVEEVEDDGGMVDEEEERSSWTRTFLLETYRGL
jgi:hypothetical protein